MICSSDSFVLFTSFALAWQLQSLVTMGPRQTVELKQMKFEERQYCVAPRHRDPNRAERLYPEVPSLVSPFDNYKVGRGDTTLIGISDGWLNKMIPRDKEAPTTLAFAADAANEVEGSKLGVESLRFGRYVNDTTLNSSEELASVVLHSRQSRITAADKNSHLHEASMNVEQKKHLDASSP